MKNTTSKGVLLEVKSLTCQPGVVLGTFSCEILHALELFTDELFFA